MTTPTAVAIPTVCSAITLEKAVESVLNQDYETEILLIQNGKAVEEVCAAFEREYENISVYRPQFNLGCSAGWNYACNYFFSKYERVFLMNDDFQLIDRDILTKIDKAYEDDPNAHWHLWGFSAVTISRELYDKVGAFDEGFWPAYYEDNDYYQRSIHLGVEWKGITDIEVFHDGSSSTRTSPWIQMLNQRTFQINKQRYIAKWGGEPHHEKYELPWDGGEPTFGNTREILEASGWNRWYE